MEEMAMQKASIPCALVARSSSIRRAAKAIAGVLIFISSCAVLCCADPKTNRSKNQMRWFVLLLNVK
jgi:hypothetical protein